MRGTQRVGRTWCVSGSQPLGAWIGCQTSLGADQPNGVVWGVDKTSHLRPTSN